MQYKNILSLIASISLVQGFVIPEGLKDGIYTVNKDKSGNEKIEFVSEFDDSVKPKMRRVPLPNGEIGVCNLFRNHTNHSLTYHSALAQGWTTATYREPKYSCITTVEAAPLLPPTSWFLFMARPKPTSVTMGERILALTTRPRRRLLRSLGTAETHHLLLVAGKVSYHRVIDLVLTILQVLVEGLGKDLWL